MKKDIITDKSVYELVFDLGEMPFVNNLEESFEDSTNCKKYPLSIVIFQNSKVTRIKEIPDTTSLFDKYLYMSGVNQPFKKHCSSMYDYLFDKNFLKDKNLIVDIGGNDGTLLTEFKNRNNTLEICNIEPSNIYLKSIENGIPTINKYFDENCFEILDRRPDLIITTNVFQHLYDIKKFATNINKLLSDDGFWCLEFPYWIETMNTMQFDQIYHEHIYYYTVQPLNLLFNQVGLKIIDCSKQFIHGGSMRLIMAKQCNKISVSDSLNDILSEESLIPSDFYKSWKDKLNRHLTFCKNEIINISKTSKIIGFGAAAKGCIFLNYLKIDYTVISNVIDDTIIKQGKYIPGTGIQIVSRKDVNFDDIDYILILAHNFSEYIIESLRKDGYKNKFIICLPEYKIIN